MSFVLRPATIHDIPQILAIVNHTIATSTANYHYEAQTLSEQIAWFKAKQLHNFPVWVAEQDELVLGYATYGIFREKIGYQYTIEHSVYVNQDYQGKGIGKSLLSKLIEQAKLEGYHIMVGGIDAKNADSIAFHQKMGFEIVGHLKEVGYKFDQWLDLCFMQRQL
jgi:phosphinothricin acetyltransferase